LTDVDTPSGAATVDLKVLKNLPGLVVCPPEEATGVPGRRSFIDYLDYGVRSATDDAVSFQLMKFKEGVDTATGWHYHTVDAQLTFILKGWIEARFEDGAVRRLPEGSAILVPGGHRHNELRVAQGSEVLEFYIGEMNTVACDPPPGI
jgi:quercetin dioxygenase-like cupin family protein